MLINWQLLTSNSNLKPQPQTSTSNLKQLAIANLKFSEINNFKLLLITWANRIHKIYHLVYLQCLEMITYLSNKIKNRKTGGHFEETAFMLTGLKKTNNTENREYRFFPVLPILICVSRFRHFRHLWRKPAKPTKTTKRITQIQQQQMDFLVVSN